MKIDQSWYIKPPGIAEHISCGGVVVRRQGNRILTALVRERHHKRYVLPKGHLEKGEVFEEAARREISEESGLYDIKLLKELGCKGRFDFSKTSWKITHYFLFSTEQVKGIPADPYHPQATVWFPIDDLPDMFWPEQQELIEQNREEIKRLG
jgi:bis(5'-nucleosidyl)-tetraphosphatase